MDKCPMCGYNEKVSNTLQNTVMNKFKDQHGNIAIFNKGNDVTTFKTVVKGEELIWTRVDGSKPKGSTPMSQALNSKQAETLAKINEEKSGTMGGDLPIMATATPEGVSPANTPVAPISKVPVVIPAPKA